MLVWRKEGELHKTYFEYTLQLFCLYVEVDFTVDHVGNTDANIFLLEVKHYRVFTFSSEEAFEELALSSKYQSVTLNLLRNMC